MIDSSTHRHLSFWSDMTDERDKEDIMTLHTSWVLTYVLRSKSSLVLVVVGMYNDDINILITILVLINRYIIWGNGKLLL